MRILAPFKVGPDLEALAESDWSPGPDMRVETRYARNILNPLDESALELALRFRDQARALGLPVELQAVSIGGEGLSAAAKTLLALKFDRVRRLAGEAPLFHPELVASLLAAEVRAYEADLVVMGGQSADGDNAQTPLILAELLKWPVLTQVTAFEPLPEGGLAATSLEDDGLARHTRPLPLCLAIGNAAAWLRVPTLKDRLEYGRREIEVVPAAAVPASAAPGPGAVLTALKPVDSRRAGLVLEGRDGQALAARLYAEFLKERLRP